MPTATSQDKHTSFRFEESAERMRDFNEQLVESGRKAGVAVVDTTEKVMKTWADYTDQMAERTHNEFISSVAHAQAQYTRTLTNAYSSAARDLLAIR